MDYREERKYLCSDYELEILRHRLCAVLPYDSHQSGGCYTIRSLYFDTEDDACFGENEAGTDNRQKFRIRTYDNNPNLIHFEIKEKKHGTTRKEVATITREEAEIFMQRKTVHRAIAESLPEKLSQQEADSQLHDTHPQQADIMDNSKTHARHEISGHMHSCYMQPGADHIDNNVLTRVSTAISMYGLHPAVIVEYERTAFVYRAGNVRITFDRNISASPNVGDFFSDKLLKIPIMPPGLHVLEVKYDEVLPGFIAQMLELGNLQRTAYSKYYLCRLATK